MRWDSRAGVAVWVEGNRLYRVISLAAAMCRTQSFAFMSKDY